LSTPELPRPETRSWIARAFTGVEDVIYVGLGLLLAAIALTLLVTGAIDFVNGARTGSLSESITPLLDRILLILLVVEVMYTVQVSFREHALAPEPFLLIGIISAMRRVLVVTAEFGELKDKNEEVFRHFIIELAALTVLIVALAFSLVLLRKIGAAVVAKRG
jgi:uncharacterized membrane protein (DUF373 family)